MSRPDLIVPIRDRRQHRRIVTLKNFRNLAIVAVVAFLGVTVYSEIRGPKAGEYGRLYRSELPPSVEPKPVEVVQEATTIDDQTHADPTLVQPMARAQWLEGETATPTTATIAPSPVPVQASVSQSGEVTIVGGPEGVSVVREQRRRPVLSGGFGRQ
ncbi:MAG TPA: hypothetical protein VF787_18030 [Thermoanaerobaculia bacterium]